MAVSPIKAGCRLSSTPKQYPYRADGRGDVGDFAALYGAFQSQLDPIIDAGDSFASATMREADRISLFPGVEGIENRPWRISTSDNHDAEFLGGRRRPGLESCHRVGAPR